MVENENELTNPLIPEKTPEKPKRQKKKFLQRRSTWIFLGFLIAFLILLAGVLLGIPRGINDRVSLAETQASPKIQAQLESAKLDIEEGRFQVALDRLDWILDEMAPYMSEAELTEVGNLYSETLLEIASYATPTPIPSPTPTVVVNTPTPDLRGEEELLNTAQQHINAEEWDEAIQDLEALRQKNLEYKSVQVDGMLYVALRNRGLQKILADGSLEPGLYDLALAERFAPLDSSAEGIRTWTRMYLTGASYWGVNWSQVVYYFEQVYPMLPNLRDGTYMTATERFWIGAVEYAEQRAEAGDFCLAQEYFDKALVVKADPNVQSERDQAEEECFLLNNPQTPTPSATP